MEKLSEILKAINTHFYILLGISATSLALLFSPPVYDYRPALKEISILQKITASQYIEYINWRTAHDRRFLPPSPDSLSDGKIVIQLIRRHYQETGVPITLWNAEPGWDIQPLIASYPAPPVDSSLAGWQRWINSTDTVRCYSPDWDWKRSVNKRQPQLTPDHEMGIIHFEIRQAPQGVRQDYSFRAYFDTTRALLSDSTDTGSRSEQAWKREAGNGWWKGMDTVDFRYINTADGHPVFTGYTMASDTQVSISNSSVRMFLQYQPYWDSITIKRSGVVSVLPALHNVWSEISNRTLDDAATFLDQKINESKKITLLGIDLSFRFIAITIPLSYLIIGIFLLLHLTYVKDQLKDIKERPVFPWLGMYTSLLARLVLFISLVIAPALVGTGILYSYASMVTGNIFAISIVLTTLATFVGIAIQYQNYVTRKRIGQLQRTQDLPAPEILQTPPTAETPSPEKQPNDRQSGP